MAGKLLLLPNLLGDERDHTSFLPASVDKAVATLDGLIAESESGGRRFLSRFSCKKKTHEMPIALFNKSTPDDDIDFLLEPLMQGQIWGLVSDAGAPCIADPGSRLVYAARRKGLTLQAFVGPISMMLALMLSGLPGQRFAFHGYLAIEADQRKKQLEELMKRSRQEGVTQIFMEAPHRNDQTLKDLLHTLDEDMKLCVCWNLTQSDQGVITDEVRKWRKRALPELHKKTALFLISG